MPKRKHWTQTPEGRQRLSEIQSRRWNKVHDNPVSAAEPIQTQNLIQTQNPHQQLHDAVQAYWNRLSLGEQLRAIAFMREGE